MARLTTSLLYSSVSELNEFIFNNGQETMSKELNDFVEEFEQLNSKDLAKTYVELTTCEKKLNQLGQINLDSTVENVKKVKSRLDELYLKVKEKQDKKVLPFEEEKQAYLKEKQARKLKMDIELRKEADKMEEYYTKKTRESIYRNLVGLNNK